MADFKRRDKRLSEDGDKKKSATDATKQSSKYRSGSMPAAPFNVNAEEMDGNEHDEDRMTLSNVVAQQRQGPKGLLQLPMNLRRRMEMQMPKGLLNQGATCCLNSICQTLFMIPEFREPILSMARNKSAMPSMVFEFGKLFHQLGNKNLQSKYQWGVSTKSLTKAMGWSDGGPQRDANELFIEILGKLDEEARFCGDIFKNKLVNSVHCLSCGNGTYAPETLLTLPLVLKDFDGQQYQNIDESLCALIKSEFMHDNIQCKSCGQAAGVEKKLGIAELAPVVALHLLRFQGHQDYATKSNARMCFPIDELVDFSPFMELPSNAHQLLNEPPAAIYQLFAVIVHSGSIRGGHYYAYVRKLSTPNQWYCFNDSHVSQAESSKLKTYFGDCDGLKKMDMPFGGNGPNGMDMPFGGNGPKGMDMPFGGNGPKGMDMPFGGNGPKGMDMPFGGNWSNAAAASSSRYNEQFAVGTSNSFSTSFADASNDEFDNEQTNSYWLSEFGASAYMLFYKKLDG